MHEHTQSLHRLSLTWMNIWMLESFRGINRQRLSVWGGCEKRKEPFPLRIHWHFLLFLSRTHFTYTRIAWLGNTIVNQAYVTTHHKTWQWNMWGIDLNQIQHYCHRSLSNKSVFNDICMNMLLQKHHQFEVKSPLVPLGDTGTQYKDTCSYFPQQLENLQKPGIYLSGRKRG